MELVRLFSWDPKSLQIVTAAMKFSRQEYRSGLSFPSPGDLPDPGMETGSPALQVDAFLSELLGKK